MKKIISSFLLISFLVVFTNTAKADVKLPKIFSNNMMLQRDKPLKVWGWADAGESVSVKLQAQNVSTKADKDGQWSVQLKPISASSKGIEITIKGTNLITLSNVLVGDVYICSGQSNMEWMLRNTIGSDQEIPNATNPMIRLFTVEKSVSFVQQKDFSKGEWLECNSTTVPTFSAVAYYFAKKLVKDVHVPIGLIHTSWGGTNIQTWISWDAIGKRDEYKNVDVNSKIGEAKEMNVKKQNYEKALISDKGMSEKWYLPATNTSDWKTMKVPGSFASGPIGNAQGLVWFRKDFEIGTAPTGTVTLGLGQVDDLDSTFVNGEFVGASNSYDVNRKYAIPAGLIKQGKNTIVVRVNNPRGNGGLGTKPEDLFLSIADSSLPLAGDWHVKKSVINTDYGIKEFGPNDFPSQLYNTMIAPIINYSIKGAIWYQGEANAGESYKYRQLFPDLIKNWRSKWNDQFPFFWVQLANFMKVDDQPVESGWAELREAQSMTLSVPKTGQAVIIDLGEAGDIHPRNKSDVGLRLALAAEKVVYGKNIVYSGPVYQSMKKTGDKITLTFANTGTGLLAKGGTELKYFSIAGADKKFVWADGKIVGKEVIVSSSNVKDPVAVRYAWSNNPEGANLYNKEGIPASPFRTDKWPGVTFGK